MEGHELSLKKKVERDYMEEARRASSVFPIGRLIAHERPDFLLQAKRGMIGIEVTELCREKPRAEAARLARVADKAFERYSQMADAITLNVSAVFAPDTEHASLNTLTKGLAEFVQANQRNKGKFDWQNCELPEGYCYIAIDESVGIPGRWHILKAFDTILVPKELLAARIQEKNQRIGEYRAAADEIWLVIINDRFLGAGEVYARPNDLGEWKFAFDFDKVLLFLRRPSGSGEVIELQNSRIETGVSTSAPKRPAW